MSARQSRDRARPDELPVTYRRGGFVSSDPRALDPLPEPEPMGPDWGPWPYIGFIVAAMIIAGTLRWLLA